MTIKNLLCLSDAKVFIGSATTAESNTNLVVLPEEYQSVMSGKIRVTKLSTKFCSIPIWFIAHMELPPFKYTEMAGWEKCGFDPRPGAMNSKEHFEKRVVIGVDIAAKGKDESKFSVRSKDGTWKIFDTEEEAMREAGKGLDIDMVNNPPHYRKGKMDSFAFIEDQKLNFAEGCVVKYVTRYKYKGTPLQDLEKAKWYLEKLIKEQQ